MLSSARQAIACVLFIFIASIFACAQVTPAKTGSVTGKITLKSKPLSGIVVAARQSNYSGMDRSRYRGTTDQTGTYRITNLPPGTYLVAPMVSGFVLDDEFRQKSLVIEEGEVIDDINFSMVRGGVITGKITDADGQPLVEQQVTVQPTEGPSAQTVYYQAVVTDDRGIYRAFGLREGKYKVSVGQADNRLPNGPRLYRETFYPSVTDSAKASLVDVPEGSEATDIDIVMGKPVTAFKVTGKIIDGETGKPVANMRYGVHRITNSGAQSTSGATSDANGEFRFEGVTPGKYSVFVAPDKDANLRADWVSFEVIDQDISGLIVKTVKASSVSGLVVLEGAEDASAVVKLGTIYVYAMFEVRESEFQGTPAVAVAPDGSFKINGLWPGVVRLGITSRGSRASQQPLLVRVERDGIPQAKGIVIKDGEHITGVKLVMRALTGAIRGQVKIEDGELPEKWRMSLWISRVDENHSMYGVANMNSSPQIDSRGRFLIEGLAAGTYEINVGLFEGGRYDSTRIFKQQVTVSDNAVSEVTVPVKLKP